MQSIVTFFIEFLHIVYYGAQVHNFAKTSVGTLWVFLRLRLSSSPCFSPYLPSPDLLIAQLAPEDLADIGLRQSITKLDLLRDLIGR